MLLKFEGDPQNFIAFEPAHGREAVGYLVVVDRDVPGPNALPVFPFNTIGAEKLAPLAVAF
jgi:hypothetical protein